VDGVDICDFGRADNPVGAQITIGAFRPTNADRLVSQLHMEGLHIGF